MGQASLLSLYLSFLFQHISASLKSSVQTCRNNQDTMALTFDLLNMTLSLLYTFMLHVCCLLLHI